MQKTIDQKLIRRLGRAEILQPTFKGELQRLSEDDLDLLISHLDAKIGASAGHAMGEYSEEKQAQISQAISKCNFRWVWPGSC